MSGTARGSTTIPGRPSRHRRRWPRRCRCSPTAAHPLRAADLPDPEPLIDNVLDQGTTALLYGKWGTAKTFIALDWAASVATGRTWQGRDTEQRRVLYVAGEGAFGFKGRVDAWETGWQHQIGDGDFDILPFPVNLTRAVDVGNLRALIDWGGYGFVILDTLARCMVGADENSAKDCGVVVDAMTRLLERHPAGAASFSAFTTPARTARHCAAHRRSRRQPTPCTSSAATARSSPWTARSARTAQNRPPPVRHRPD